MSSLRYYDVHLHLQDERLTRLSADPEEWIDPKVEKMIVNGRGPFDWLHVAELAKHPRIRPAFGLHPWWVEERPEHWESDWVRFLDETPGALVGEIGLDKWIRPKDYEDQKQVFARQLDIAIERKLTPTIHCLQAWGTLYEILQTRRSNLKTGFLLHSYSGPPEMVEDFIDLGAYFSMSGYFARPEKPKKLEAWKKIPLERTLVETDAPDMMPPDSLVGFPLPSSEDAPVNHPRNLVAIYEWVADFKQVPLSTFARQVEDHFRELFGNQC